MRFCTRHTDSPCAGSSSKLEEWVQVRRFYLRGLRHQTKSIILLLALIEILKHSPVQLVYAGHKGFPAPTEQDYGITYNVAFILSWVYICAFAVVYVPLFSWWLPRLALNSTSGKDGASPSPSKLEKLSAWLQKINMITLPICTAVSAFFYVVLLLEVLLYVDERRVSFWQMPQNTKKIWRGRGLLLIGMATSLGLGFGAFQTWEALDLAKVKPFEYAMIVIPVQINIGVMLGTVMEMKIEKRARMKQAQRETHVEEQGSLVNEKAALMS